MGKQDWYRRTTWTAADKAEFANRLNRSRTPFHKAQYLRIQATYLQQIGGPEMLRAALVLLDELLEKYPDEFSLGSAYLQKAQCLEALGQTEEALEIYRASLAAQRLNPSVRDSAHIAFGELVLRLGRKDLYPEVVKVFEEFGGYEYFPAEQYRYNAIRAFALEEVGRKAEAREAARLALTASGKTESPFRYHRQMGVVTKADPEVERRLAVIGELIDQ